jgi:GNAT superfamily N-acetyltransferase
VSAGPARPEPVAICVEPATAERWPDVLTIMGAGGERGCWCQAPRGRATGPGHEAGETRRESLERQVRGDDPPPGLLAYVDGEVAGWIGFGPRAGMPRLARSRTIPAVDDRDIWSIVCFLIRVGYRRRGVAKALLDGVVALARERGAPGVEAYPVDPAGGRVDVAFGYVGFTPMFERAGFRRVLQTDAHSAGRPRWLMRLDLD